MCTRLGAFLALLAVSFSPPPSSAKTVVLHPVDGAVLNEAGGLLVGFCDDPETYEITVEFKEFGVSLAFTPTVLSGSLISLKVAPEVSSIDP